ncbi:sulfatase family protein [Brachybacterium subflavum]|uniref:sulfatase family protein n=1 Tax=Brachybacterium subflavum TaxID=2585206 RepID=UPI001266789B|nr:sulfatase [Brachybacterium subflavum]
MRVLYIDVDSLRPDHLGAHGYERPTSPTIDALAERSTVMEQTYSSSSPCGPSRGCLMSGVFGIRHGVLTHWGPGSRFRFPGQAHTYFRDAPTLTRHLRENGVSTVSFSSFMDRHQMFWFGAGWSQMNTFTLKQGDEDADEVNAAVIPWLREKIRTTPDLFLHVQYWEPHRNYTMPERWAREVEHAPIPSWLTPERVAAHRESAAPYSPQELFPGRRREDAPTPSMPRRIDDLEDAHRFFDGYDGAVRYLDDQIGMLLHELDLLGVLEDTAIILSADHGEALGEQSVYGDHTSAANAVHHVPMIVHWPGAPAHRQQGLTYQLDMDATICDLLGVPVPEGWDSRSFAPAVRGESGWSGRDQLVWDHGLYCAQRVVRTPQWLYQRTYHPGVFEHRPTSLYDAEDVHQIDDVADAHPGTVAELEEELVAWRREQLARTDLPDPLDEILAGGGPYRYVQLEQWMRLLGEHGRESEARRLRAHIEATARTCVA